MTPTVSFLALLPSCAPEGSEAPISSHRIIAQEMVMGWDVFILNMEKLRLREVICFDRFASEATRTGLCPGQFDHRHHAFGPPDLRSVPAQVSETAMRLPSSSFGEKGFKQERADNYCLLMASRDDSDIAGRTYFDSKVTGRERHSP